MNIKNKNNNNIILNKNITIKSNSNYSTIKMQSNNNSFYSPYEKQKNSSLYSTRDKSPIQTISIKYRNKNDYQNEKELTINKKNNNKNLLEFENKISLTPILNKNKQKKKTFYSNLKYDDNNNNNNLFKNYSNINCKKINNSINKNNSYNKDNLQNKDCSILNELKNVLPFNLIDFQNNKNNSFITKDFSQNLKKKKEQILNIKLNNNDYEFLHKSPYKNDILKNDKNILTHKIKSNIKNNFVIKSNNNNNNIQNDDNNNNSSNSSRTEKIFLNTFNPKLYTKNLLSNNVSPSNNNNNELNLNFNYKFNENKNNKNKEIKELKNSYKKNENENSINFTFGINSLNSSQKKNLFFSEFNKNKNFEEIIENKLNNNFKNFNIESSCNSEKNLILSTYKSLSDEKMLELAKLKLSVDDSLEKFQNILNMKNIQKNNI